MRPVSPTLLLWLMQRKPTIPVDLFQFSFLNGQTLNVCSYAPGITYNGVTYYGSGVPIVTRTDIEIKNTVEVPELKVTLLSTGTDFASTNIKQAIINGLFDGCELLLTRLFLNPANNQPIGSVQLFDAVTGPITASLTGAKITFRGKNVRMEQNFPVNIYQTGCIWSLYSPQGCKVNRSTYTFEGVVNPGSTNRIIVWEGTPPGSTPANFGLGVIEFTSGVAEGDIGTIQTVNENGVTLVYPLQSIPEAGDTFNISYGCTKTLTYCTNVFGNQQRWRGFPYIPPAEYAF